jgi:hypothetical protein
VEVNTVDKATDAHGHPSKDSNDRNEAENMDVDEPDMIHEGSETNDANAKQPESIVDNDVEMNDISTTIEQGLQEEAVFDSVEMDKVDKTTDAFGHSSTDSDDKINERNTIIDQGRDFFI